MNLSTTILSSLTHSKHTIPSEANNVHGTIPKEIEQLNGLRLIFLEGAFDDADYEDGSLEFLTGPIPTEIGTLDELRVLDLNYNMLDGSVRIETTSSLMNIGLLEQSPTHLLFLNSSPVAFTTWQN